MIPDSLRKKMTDLHEVHSVSCSQNNYSKRIMGTFHSYLNILAVQYNLGHCDHYVDHLIFFTW